MTLTGVWNQFANLVFPVCALFFLTLDGQTNPGLTTAAFVGVAVLGAAVGGLVLVLYSADLARDVGQRLRKRRQLVPTAGATRPCRVGRRGVRTLPGRGGVAPAPAVALAHADHARRTPHRLPRSPRLAPRTRGAGVRGVRGGGVRSLGARPHPRGDTRSRRAGSASSSCRSPRAWSRSEGTTRAWSRPFSCTGSSRWCRRSLLGGLAALTWKAHDPRRPR